MHCLRHRWRFVAFLVALGFIWTTWQAYQRLLIEWTDRDDVQTAYHSDIGQLTTYLDSSLDERPVLFCVNNIEETLLSDGNIRRAEPP